MFWKLESNSNLDGNLMHLLIIEFENMPPYRNLMKMVDRNVEKFKRSIPEDSI